MRDISLFALSQPELAPHLCAAHFSDESRERADADLRGFLSGMSGRPAPWLRTLFLLRAPLGLALAQRPGLALPPTAPDDVPFAPGAAFGPFRVELAREERLWLGRFATPHLVLRLAVAVEILPCGERLFHLLTMAVANSARGRLYLGLMRPFHGIVSDHLASLGSQRAAWRAERRTA